MDEERGARPLAEAQREVEVGREPEVLEHHGVAGLGRAVRGEERVARVGGERHRDERGGARDKAVEDHGDAAGGAGEDHADEPGDLKAADLGEDVQTITRVGDVHGERAADDVHLTGERRVVHAGAAARDALGAGARDRRGDRARRGGVADPHLAGREEIGARVERLLREPRAGLERLQRLCARHRRAPREIGGAGCDRAGVEPGRARDRVRHAEVRDDHARLGLTREDVHRGAATQEGFDHLHGHDLRVRAHALGDDAVVGGEGEDVGPLDARRPAGERGEARGDLLEPPQASGRLRQAVEVALRLGESPGRRGRDRATEPGEHRRTS